MQGKKYPWAEFLRAESPARGVRVWSETAAITIAVMLLAFWLRPGDPFLQTVGFPWLWLCPMLLALRHGSRAGLFSSLLIVVAWTLARQGNWLAQGEEFPKGYFLGGFIAALSCGEFRDIWFSQIFREKRTRGHLEHRLDSLARSHQTLLLSHDRLQAGFLTHPPTLRDALAELSARSVSDLNPESAQAFLTLLSRFFQLEVGALHLIGKDGPVAAAVASLGPVREIYAGDPLVGAALSRGELCYALQKDGDTPPGRYLFSAPLMAADGRKLAVLVAESMPFFAFQEENLRSLFSVMGYYADRLQTSEAAATVKARLSDCPEDFAAEYLRLHRLGAQSGLESALAAVVLPSGAALPVSAMRQVGRSLDLFWSRSLPGKGKAMIALLPFCGKAPAMAFLSRLDDKLAAIEGGAGASFKKVTIVNAVDPLAGLESFLDSLSRGDRADG